jgi:hypothetical protein
VAADGDLGFAGQEDIVSPCHSLNALALANLDKWAPVLFGDIAIFQKGTGAYRIKGAVMGSELVTALGRDPEITYEEDLSLHPNGIIDYGVATDAEGRETGQGRYSALDLVMAVLGLDLDGAFTWLSERLCDPEPEISVAGNGSGGNGGGGGNGAQSIPGPTPEPKPTPKADDWPILHSDAMHGLAGEVVRTIEPHTESDPVALLIQTIVYFGSAIGRGPYYQIEDDKHYTNLFADLVGESSYSRKGTSAGRVRALFLRIDTQWSLTCIDGGLSSGEGIIHRIRDRRETLDRKGKPLIDEGVPDKRFLIDEGEFYGALAVMKREGNTLSPVIRNAWDGRPLRTLTKNNPDRVAEPHVSVIAHITENELRNNLGHASMVNGFANRFLFVLVRRSKRLPHGGATLDEETKDKLGFELRSKLENARNIGRIIMALDTAEMWAPIYNRMCERPPGLYADACKRGDAQTIRLSMLYALLDGSAVIEPVHLRAGLALWDYCERSTLRIFGDKLGEPVADDILTRLRMTKPRGLSRTGISEVLDRHRSTIAITQALLQLLAAGKVWKEPRKGPREPEMWFAT